MALDQGKLRAELAAIYRSYPASPRESARRMAAAYDAYARKALAAPGKPSFTGAEVKLLEAQLAPAIANPRAGSPARIAQAWSVGVQAYWMSPPVMFSGSGVAVGLVTAMPGAAALVPALMSVYANVRNSPEGAAQRIAAALHAATTSTLVTLTMIGPPPFPLIVPVA